MTNEAQKLLNEAKMTALFDAAHKAMPDEIRKATLLAKVRRVHYLASLAEGFTADESLVLCVDTDLS